MNFLRTLFWMVVVAIAAIFSVRNWTPPVTIHLWGGIDADVKLPVLLLAAFLIGLLPMMIVHHATRWHLRRRLETAERALSLSSVAAAPPVAEEGAVPLPPASGSVAIPPAVA